MSKEVTTKIVSAIKGDTEFSLQEHTEKIVETHSKLHNEQMEQDRRNSNTVLESMESIKRRVIMRAVDGFNWLTVMPISPFFICWQLNLMMH